MMKHVQLSPYRSRADTVSLSSTTSYGSLSPEPLGSRSSSYSSLSESNPQTTIKVYARCLRPDIEYKTLGISFQTTCREVVGTLLGKYKMKHRDPKLFYLSMEVTVRKAGVRTHLALDDEARPAVLQSCHPKGDSKFSLQTKRGGLVKVYDSALNNNSQYKCLLISSQTTSDEVISLLLTCCNSKERVEQFSIYEVCTDKEQQRKLHPDDRPLQVQHSWLPSLNCHFLVRRNPEYSLPLSRRKIYWVPELPPIPSNKRQQLAYRSQLLSRSQNSLLPCRGVEEKIKSTKDSSSNKKSEMNSKQVSLSMAEKPSYADYENYFYI
ncbi:hypothetical protein PPYR_08217 [Photinus pyralis]|uniref:Ras-associating domain-containing protein n=1 Tax=Photinus pyralis TaxID=7054 RepID=A0A1Y1KLD8_PHOPY|nr:uncharacterized protein LOC116171219 [Photinus pyralis]XP_031343803.1 uncharacterized protein LOC116171219 [Photinus pyralis]KAB0797223.1 hypothetical protein PPYR_08217 [Photinus pyralis]